MSATTSARRTARSANAASPTRSRCPIAGRASPAADDSASRRTTRRAYRCRFRESPGRRSGFVVRYGIAIACSATSSSFCHSSRSGARPGASPNVSVSSPARIRRTRTRRAAIDTPDRRTARPRRARRTRRAAARTQIARRCFGLREVDDGKAEGRDAAETHRSHEVAAIHGHLH